jgi:hypothetical protein
MDVSTEDDSVLMSMMGLSGFGTTKVAPFLAYRSHANDIRR